LRERKGKDSLGGLDPDLLMPWVTTVEAAYVIEETAEEEK